jgi:hypothetical protein
MKSNIFWDVTSCSLVEVCRCSRGNYCLHLQSRRVSQAPCLLLGLILDSEDEGKMFLRNVGQGGVSQAIIVFIFSAVRTSNVTFHFTFSVRTQCSIGEGYDVSEERIVQEEKTRQFIRCIVRQIKIWNLVKYQLFLIYSCNFLCI